MLTFDSFQLDFTPLMSVSTIRFHLFLGSSLHLEPWGLKGPSKSPLPESRCLLLLVFLRIGLYAIQIHFLLIAGHQWRNHVFRVGGPIPRSRVLLPFYRKKLDRSIRFDAVGYIITLYSSISYVKSWRSVQILRGLDSPLLPWLRPCWTLCFFNRCR